MKILYVFGNLRRVDSAGITPVNLGLFHVFSSYFSHFEGVNKNLKQFHILSVLDHFATKQNQLESLQQRVFELSREKWVLMSLTSTY